MADSQRKMENRYVKTIILNSFDPFLYRKPVKKKVQTKKNKTSNEKNLNQRQRSMRWKDIRLVAGDDR